MVKDSVCVCTRADLAQIWAPTSWVNPWTSSLRPVPCRMGGMRAPG